ncbi:MAG: hypothetical protein N2205_00775 [Candidatus Caldatribacterium sp.]|nr:hypothetical protein [Candidatus Caldatribacterium sp.]
MCRHCDPEPKKRGIYRCLLGEKKERTQPVDRCDYFFPDHLATAGQTKDA